MASPEPHRTKAWEKQSNKNVHLLQEEVSVSFVGFKGNLSLVGIVVCFFSQGTSANGGSGGVFLWSWHLFCVGF